MAVIAMRTSPASESSEEGQIPPMAVLANVGLPEASALLERDQNCTCAIEAAVQVIHDARLDPRFASHPLVAGPPNVVFLAILPLLLDGVTPMGVLIVADTVRHRPSSGHIDALQSLAKATAEAIRQQQAHEEFIASERHLRQNLVQAARQADIVSRTDELTAAYNRRAWELDSPLLQRSPNADNELDDLVAVLDLDHLKLVNDEYGHAAGDALLQQFVAQIGQVLRRPTDRLYRMGGDEFVVVLPRCDGLGRAEFVARLQNQLQHWQHDGQQHPLAFSIGTAWLSEVNWDPDAAVDLADQRMYQHKRDRQFAAAGKAFSDPDSSDIAKLDARQAGATAAHS